MSNLQKILFIDRDGTLINETPDEQIDSFAKLTFYPGALQYLPKIAKELDFELVMVTNQDGLGTTSYPEDTFWPVQNFILKTFENEGVVFSNICIDRTFPAENALTRKPATGLLTQYFDTEKYWVSKPVAGLRVRAFSAGKVRSMQIFENTTPSFSNVLRMKFCTGQKVSSGYDVVPKPSW